MKENDWAFNYEDKDRKCYTFAYYTVKDEINNYCKNHSEAKIKEIMYKITRIHENGAIRTYNKNNDIFDGSFLPFSITQNKEDTHVL